MEVHRQTCQACGSIDTRNILVRESGHPTHVYVRCGRCGELVARYVLAEYYHHGKDIESFLRSQGAGANDSARHWLDAFERSRKDALDGYTRALQALQEQNKGL